MTDTDLMNRGRDFLIGFVPTLVVAGVALGMVFTTKSLYPPAWAGGGMFAAVVIAFFFRRPFIAVGIITVIVAVPLLLVGTCFVALAGLDI